MNFATQALVGLDEMVDAFQLNRWPLDVTGALLVRKSLLEAQKFVVPPPDKLNITVRSEALSWLRCPYPVWTVEYEILDAKDYGAVPGVGVTGKSTRRIALCIDLQNKANHLVQAVRAGSSALTDSTVGFLVVSLFYYDNLGVWSMSPGCAVVTQADLADPNRMPPGTEFSLSDKMFRLPVEVFPILPDTFNELAAEHEARNPGSNGADFVCDVIHNDVWEEAATAIRVVIMMNARNVKSVKVSEASSKLNQKRARNGRPPFFTYHTLNAFFGGRARETRRMDQAQLMRLFTQSRLGAGLQTVVGHFKVRKTGVFFWRGHLRGSAENGVIVKDYNLKTEKSK
jgi:hypothetical protein